MLAASAMLQKGVVIALVGPRRSGKDTVAEFLGHPRVQIAGPLKEGVSRMFGIPREDLETDAKDRPAPGLGGHTPREIMQRLGTEFAMPLMGRDVWVRQCVRDVTSRLSSGAPAVTVTDMRFPHEYAALREAFGDALYVVRVTRPGFDRARKGDAVDAHASETAHASIPADHVLNNTGTLRDLAWKVMTMPVPVPVPEQ